MKLAIETLTDSGEILKRIGLFIMYFSHIESLLHKYLEEKGIDSSEMRFSGKLREIKKILGKNKSIVKKLEHPNFKGMREKISHWPLSIDMHSLNSTPRFGLKKNNRTYITIKSLDKSIDFARDLLGETFCLTLNTPTSEVEKMKALFSKQVFGFSDGRC